MHELSSPRVDQSARCPVRELAIRELAYLRVVQLPSSLTPVKSRMVYLSGVDFQVVVEKKAVKQM